jgi:hypothetical protein
MKGLVVNGFTVVEALGSGQGGVLYLARDGEGREAVIRVAREGEDNVSIRIFIEEARQLLPEATELETPTASDGRRVLMALATAAAPVPGSGHSQHAVTQRLPRSIFPEPKVPPRVSLVLMLVALAVFGAGAAMVAMASKGTPPAPVAALPEVHQGAPPPAPLVPQTPDAGDSAVDALVPTPASPVAVPVKPVRPKAVRPPIDCTPDARWRRIMSNDLNEVRDLVAAKSSLEQYAAFEEVQVGILERASRAVTPEQCAAVQAEVDRVVRKYLPR